MSHKSRLAKLEAKHAPKAATRVKVVYADQIAPGELEAMRNDATIGALVIIEYADMQPVSQSQTVITHSR